MQWAATLAIVGLLGITTAGCGGGPFRTTETVRDEGYLRFSGGKPGQVIYVDGIRQGSTDELVGASRVLATASGLRTIEVREADRVVHSDRVFVGNGVTKTVDLP